VSLGQAGQVSVEESAEDRCRPMRADAQKNRARLLVAAEEVFAERGVSVPIDDVAQRAGVGVGTLYRHFPTKEALFVAVVATRLEQLRDESKGLLDASDPGRAFFVFAEHLAEQMAGKRDLTDALAEAGVDIKAEMAVMGGDVMAELQDNVQKLIDRAQKSGAIRGDVSAAELFGLIAGSCMAGHQHGMDHDAQKRMLSVVFDGLRRHDR
jgi:AcrR family transcriptional regulator